VVAMPDRVLRSGLFTSEAWLSLKNNDDRVCWIVLFGNADVFGNQPAGPHRLVHIWRHTGIDSPEKAAKVLLELGDADLVRVYEIEGKRYVHIPRYAQRLRYLGKFCPLSQWNTDEEKQRVTKKSPEHHRRPPEHHRRPPADVDVDVDVEAVQDQHLLLDSPKEPANASGRARKDVEPGFLRFWSAYPPQRRRGKAESLKIWRAKKLEAVVDVVLADVSRRKTSDEAWLRGFETEPARYLRRALWDDGVPARKLDEFGVPL